MSKFGMLLNLFIFVLNLHVSANGYSRRAHDSEHPAWGGNGGYWGNRNSPWDGDTGWSDRNSYNSSFYRSNTHYSQPNYYYNPQTDDYTNSDINGAAFYINLR